jgi:hypothetical protein
VLSRTSRRRATTGTPLTSEYDLGPSLDLVLRRLTSRCSGRTPRRPGDGGLMPRWRGLRPHLPMMAAPVVCKKLDPAEIVVLLAIPAPRLGTISACSRSSDRWPARGDQRQCFLTPGGAGVRYWTLGVGRRPSDVRDGGNAARIGRRGRAPALPAPVNRASTSPPSSSFLRASPRPHAPPRTTRIPVPPHRPNLPPVPSHRWWPSSLLPGRATPPSI